MKTHNRLLRKTALAAAVVLLVGGVSTMDRSITGGTGFGFIASAYAHEDGGGNGGGSGGHQGAMGEGRGGQGGKGAGGAGYRGGKAVQDVLAADDDGDDDSDRPDWAGVPGGEGRPGGGGNNDPGVTKGDLYGDMILLVRDPKTGLPIKTDDGWTLACTDEACTPELAVEMVDGEVPEGTTTFEVDLGRGSMSRTIDSVLARRLDEVLGVIESGESLTQDEAGRIVVVFEDGTTKTIDSPLENLAMYIDLMEGLASKEVSDIEEALGKLANLETAAALLGAMADKTGDISLDYLMYENMITGLVDSADEYYDFSKFKYTRDYDTSYDFLYLPPGEVVPVAAAMDINDYLEYVNGELPATKTAALFAAAADDAVEVIELLHTQIVDDAFLDGYDGYVIK